jgi:hypothetical protein
MRVKRTAAIVLGGGAVAAWLAGAATSNRALPDPIVTASKPIDARGADLASEVARLHERLRPSTTPRAPARNLFTFRAVPAPVAVAAPTQAALTEAPPPPRPAPAPFKLTGIGEDVDNGAPVRMAFISGEGQLFIVKQGEQVTARYRVASIAADAVELLDVTDNTTRRLVMK